MTNDPISIFETNFNNLLGLFLGRGTSILLGPERGAARPVTIINKQSGKALEVENASIDQAARIEREIVFSNSGRVNAANLGPRRAV